MDPRKRALALHEKGLSYREIGRRLGVTHGTVWKWCNPRRTTMLRHTDNAKRQAQKNAWERARNRREDVRGRCTTCGTLMGVGVEHDGICISCRVAAKEARWERIAALWVAGASMSAIAAELGITRNHLGEEMARMREAGRDLPYRYRNTKRQRVAA